jgi:hypothetical protein
MDPAYEGRIDLLVDDMQKKRAATDAAPGRIEEQLSGTDRLAGRKVRVICRMLAAGFTNVQFH